MACVSPNVRTTRSESFASFGSSDSFLNAFSHTLCSRVRKSRNDVHFPEYPHDCKQSLALFWSSGSVLSVRPHILYFSIKIFMVLFEKSTVRTAVFNGRVIIFFRIRSGIKAAKAFCVVICTQIEFSPRLQMIVTSNTAIKICSHLSGLLYKKYP